MTYDDDDDDDDEEEEEEEEEESKFFMYLPCVTTYRYGYYSYFFHIAGELLVSHGLLTIETSRSHSDTSHSVWLLWTGDRVVA